MDQMKYIVHTSSVRLVLLCKFAVRSAVRSAVAARSAVRFAVAVKSAVRLRSSRRLILPGSRGLFIEYVCFGKGSKKVKIMLS